MKESQVGKDPRRMILKFLLLFGLLLVAFQVAFSYGFVPTDLFDRYLGWNATVAAGLLRLVGIEASSTGPMLETAAIHLKIERGCDAIQPCGIFITAMLAFPGGGRRKVLAVLGGTLFLLALNVLRVTTLYFIGAHMPASFELFHMTIWPAAFVAVALLLFMLWMNASLKQGVGFVGRGA